MPTYHKRKYKPVHPQKYVGDPTDIVCRSSWETRFAIWCDHNPAIIEWGSETTIIPYICPTDNRAHRYFVDFKIKVKDRTGRIKTYLVEIKPDKQTRPPDTPKRKTRQFINEVMTWGKNDAKWKAARDYCADRGIEFIILTEYDLGIAKKPLNTTT
jgi:hypothetical protein